MRRIPLRVVITRTITTDCEDTGPTRGANQEVTVKKFYVCRVVPAVAGITSLVVAAAAASKFH